jgi:hypothetical protein
MLRFAPTAALIVLTAMPGAGHAVTLTTLHAFHGNKDGANPEGGVIIDNDGVLYGTADTGGGGSRNSGVVFSLTPPSGRDGKWAFKPLHRFTGGSDGGYPVDLSMDANGNLFGYTVIRFGTVFELKKPVVDGQPWRFQTLYTFSGGTDGAYPNSVAAQPDGSVIGTTSAGGIGPCTYASNDPPTGCGVLFRLTSSRVPGAPWRETLLHSFTGGSSDGARPNGAPIAIDGSLLGVALQGGSGNCIDGGTGTVGGCGVVYRLAPDGQGGWSESVVRDFLGGTQGAGPFAGLVADGSGAFYGVTASGGDTTGDPNGNGLVYQLLPVSGGYVVNPIHRFTSGDTDGSHPEGGLLVAPDGTLFGTTEFGPSGYHGTAFSLAYDPVSHTWGETILAKFAAPDGVFAVGKIARDQAGAIYGVTYQGGKLNDGTVYRLQ